MKTAIEQVLCSKCGAAEYGQNTWEEEDCYQYVFYCRNCLHIAHSFDFPKPSAFGIEDLELQERESL